uniref:TSA: Wollemia nobilis Ref_Wollemi_Transcript_28887_1569 transcribed RNA sequence n=1 Tax=Wollemia nobilis TaxID=56998 RepID=A0A0C9QL30_9CONI
MELSAPPFTLTHNHLLVRLTHNAKLSLGSLKTIQNYSRESIRRRGRIRIRGAACRTNTTEKDRGRNEACTHLLFDIDGGVPGNEWIVRRFSASSLQSKPPPKQKEDFYINTGYAVRALREQLPSMFYKEPTFDIYREDIVFRDPLNTFSGIDNYKLIFWALRFHGKIFFKALWIDILRIWHPAEKVIMIRWTIYGIPRVPWEAQGRFDGTSEYKLDSDGKIYEHKVDNIELSSRPKFSVPLVESLIGALGSPSTPRPTYFETIGIVFWMLLPYLIQFTWVRYYVAMKGTVDLKNATLGFNSVHV